MSDLAASGIPAVISLEVLGLGRSAYYRWLAQPVTDSELREAYLANALFDAHRDDPEFGYRFLFDEVTDAGHVVSERTVWRICSDNGWWSAFGKKKRGKKGKVGAPAHDDLVRRDFTAAGPNQLWLTDLTEHRTDEGKLYLCAIKDVWSNRIVGYSISDRMESKIAVDALNSAVARRGGDVAGCTLHSDRGSQWKQEPPAGVVAPPDRGIDGPGRVSRRQRRHGELLRAAAEERPQPPTLGDPRAAPHRDRVLDRADLPPPPTPRTPRPIDPHRVRTHHEQDRRSGSIEICPLIVQQSRSAD